MTNNIQNKIVVITGASSGIAGARSCDGRLREPNLLR